MSIGEGDPYTSAKELAWMFKDVVTRKKPGPFPQPWLSRMNEEFQLGLSLSGQRVKREEIADQLRIALFGKIDTGTLDFYVLQPFFEEALHIPEEERFAHRMRVREVESAMGKAVLDTVTSIALEYDTSVFSDPKCKEPLREIVTNARKRGLQKAGVLTSEGDIVPGQEQYVPADLFPPRE